MPRTPPVEPVLLEPAVSAVVPPRPTPALASRLRGVASSPVRELLALLDRPEVASFAGGVPAPELFDVEGLRAAFARALAADRARRALQGVLRG